MEHLDDLEKIPPYNQGKLALEDYRTIKDYLSKVTKRPAENVDNFLFAESLTPLFGTRVVSPWKEWFSSVVCAMARRLL